mmetsp:Transcript_4770/g.10273  ORF Transcript_4770/g.10273 Transcript_4770/m.10273 type:complete len:229 (-) Transcript_4770:98-784(-)
MSAMVTLPLPSLSRTLKANITISSLLLLSSPFNPIRSSSNDKYPLQSASNDLKTRCMSDSFSPSPISTMAFLNSSKDSLLSPSSFMDLNFFPMEMMPCVPRALRPARIFSKATSAFKGAGEACFKAPDVSSFLIKSARAVRISGVSLSMLVIVPTIFSFTCSRASSSPGGGTAGEAVTSGDSTAGAGEGAASEMTSTVALGLDGVSWFPKLIELAPPGGCATLRVVRP